MALSFMVALVLLAVVPAGGLAARGQVAIIQDDVGLLTNPGATLQEMRHLGAQMVRVSLRWSMIAPAPNSHRRPRFNASDPNAYPAASWAPFDAIVRDAAARGIQVMFVPTAFAPIWAQGPNPGRYGGKYDSRFAWMPSATEFGAFVHAAGARYSGGFLPKGSLTPLPRVRVWELYNEPNFGEDLAPQAIAASTVPAAPRMYRALAGAAWNALRATGHGRDVIVIGALSAHGAALRPSRVHPQGLPGTYGETKPLVFTRELYCLDSRYRQYRGRAAAARGCPTTAAGYRRFRAQNPVLFNASGFSVHPYVLSRGVAPNQAASRDPNHAEFSQLAGLAKTLDRIQRIYHSLKRFLIWNTEYGYITCPPNCHHRYVSPATAASYINWAEYLSWRNPRIASTSQYLLFDPNPSVGTPEYGGFASGLVFHPSVRLVGGQPKPGYFAYRLPIYLPSTTARRGRTLEVWGAVRPAPFASRDRAGPQYAQIQFAPRSSSSWRTIKTLKVTDPHGYLDTRAAFPSSGSVRIAYTYPPLDTALVTELVTRSTGAVAASGLVWPAQTITSRTVNVTIR